LIPAQPPKEAIEARRRQASHAVHGDDDHYHTVANPAEGEKPGERGLNKGYRPGRKSAKSGRGTAEAQARGRNLYRSVGRQLRLTLIFQSPASMSMRPMQPKHATPGNRSKPTSDLAEQLEDRLARRDRARTHFGIERHTQRMIKGRAEDLRWDRTVLHVSA